MSTLKLPDNIKVAVGLLGYTGSGKTTMARRIAYEFPSVACYSFADGVREAVAPMIPLHMKSLDLTTQEAKWRRLAEGAGTIRDLMVAVGSSARSVWPDVWVARLGQRVVESSGNARLLVVDDVRHWNEVELLRTAPMSLFFWLTSRGPGRPGGDTDLWSAQVRSRLGAGAVTIDPYRGADVIGMLTAISLLLEEAQK